MVHGVKCRCMSEVCLIEKKKRKQDAWGFSRWGLLQAYCMYSNPSSAFDCEQGERMSGSTLRRGPATRSHKRRGALVAVVARLGKPLHVHNTTA